MLHGVDAISATSALAVGEANSVAAALRWTGSSWSKAPVATPSGATSALNDITAFSATNAWGVGRVAPTLNGLTLVEHWQGSSWTQVTSPTPAPRNTLTAVARQRAQRRLGGRVLARSAVRQPSAPLADRAL